MSKRPQVKKLGAVRERLDSDHQRLMDVASERGASVWLCALLLKEYGFDLHKGSFRDAICIRWGWQPPQISSVCICGKPFNVDHALLCPYDGFPTLWHNELQNLTASVMKEVWHNVTIEPPLQSLSGETLSYSTAGADGARLEWLSMNFGETWVRELFSILRWSTLSLAHTGISLSSVHKRVEEEKKRKYDQWVWDIEYGSFSPLIFSTNGGLAPISWHVYKRIAALQSEKSSKPYNSIINYIRCKLSFSLLRSTIRCLTGTRSAFPWNHNIEIDNAISDGHILSWIYYYNFCISDLSYPVLILNPYHCHYY